MTTPGLSDLDAFVAVARARSFRGAAALRGASASALSEALRRLEAALGVRLLNRTTRSVTPTEAGQRLLERLAPALGEIEGALDVVNGFRETPRGTLRLNVPTIVAKKILPPIVARFLSAYPGVTLEIATNDALIDVLAAGFDAGIRYEERIERDMIAVPIGPRVQRYIAAAAPSYLSQRGTPSHPRQPRLHPPQVRERGAGRLGIPAGRGDRAHKAGWAACGLDDGIGARRGRFGVGRHLEFRGIPARGAGPRRLDRGARRLAAELLGAVPLLSQPQHARPLARLRRLHPQISRREAISSDQRALRTAPPPSGAAFFASRVEAINYANRTWIRSLTTSQTSYSSGPRSCRKRCLTR
jgi:DNA-binding transcriptional LysR family regulator